MDRKKRGIAGNAVRSSRERECECTELWCCRTHLNNCFSFLFLTLWAMSILGLIGMHAHARALGNGKFVIGNQRLQLGKIIYDIIGDMIFAAAPFADCGATSQNKNSLSGITMNLFSAARKSQWTSRGRFSP